jgi:hypothetical protein
MGGTPGWATSLDRGERPCLLLPDHGADGSGNASAYTPTRRRPSSPRGWSSQRSILPHIKAHLKIPTMDVDSGGLFRPDKKIAFTHQKNWEREATIALTLRSGDSIIQVNPLNECPGCFWREAE